MKVKEGYVLREVAGQIIVVPTGDAALNFNGVINLNAPGKLLWEMLQNEVEVEDLVAGMLAKYEVSREVALKDVEEFLATLKEKKILE